MKFWFTFISTENKSTFLQQECSSFLFTQNQKCLFFFSLPLLLPLLTPDLMPSFLLWYRLKLILLGVMFSRFYMVQQESVLHFFYEWILFPYMHVSHFISLFFSWWVFGFPLFWTMVNGAAPNIHVQIFVWTFCINFCWVDS